MNSSPDNLRRVGLIANTDKPDCRPHLQRAASLLEAAGRTLLSDKPTADLGGLRCPVTADAVDLAGRVDLLLVFGGDGTMLRAARDASAAGTPILGVNAGGLGFLTATSMDQIEWALGQVWSGRFLVESRSLIEATGAAFSHVALNDFVISRGAVPRLIELDVKVDEEMLTRYRGDGLIVCTPTGSTAYSLAAGGAIVSPRAEVMTLTPICPHTLSNRSVVVSLASVIEVRVLSQRVETMLTADGQVQSAVDAGELIRIRRSPRAARLVRLEGGDFFDTLRQKLHWSGSHF